MPALASHSIVDGTSPAAAAAIIAQPMKSAFILLPVASLSAILCGCGAGGPESAEPVGHVYLFRGQGWAFSSGFRSVCERLRSAGLAAEDLSDTPAIGPSNRSSPTARRAACRGQLVLVGHSRGGRVCLRAAKGSRPRAWPWT